MPVYPYEGVSPQIESDVLLCPGAMVVGRVKIGEVGNRIIRTCKNFK